jgi:hypothetical protein
VFADRVGDDCTASNNSLEFCRMGQKESEAHTKHGLRAVEQECKLCSWLPSEGRLRVTGCCGSSKVIGSGFSAVLWTSQNGCWRCMGQHLFWVVFGVFNRAMVPEVRLRRRRDAWEGSETVVRSSSREAVKEPPQKGQHY